MRKTLILLVLGACAPSYYPVLPNPNGPVVIPPPPHCTRNDKLQGCVPTPAVNTDVHHG